jgi:purine-binding chemotaxis protein CheW
MEPENTETSQIDEVTDEQVVTFRLGEELFAFPMKFVREIVRMPETVRVPLARPELIGVANLRGQVLPVVSLRSQLSLPEKSSDASTRVIVVDDGDTVGFVVDGVASVLTVQPEQHEPVDRLRTTIDVGVVSSVLKGVSGGIALVLDVEALVRSSAASSKLARSEGDEAGASTATAREGAEADVRQLVSFGMAGQEYAIDIESVQEIVQLPPTLTKVPNAPPHVLGVMTLRERLIPLVSLRTILGLPPDATLTQQRIVLTSLDAGGSVVGIVTDTVDRVLRIASEDVREVPAFLRAQRGSEALSAICRLDDGKRLVSILSAERLFDHDLIKGALDAGRDVRQGAPSEVESDKGTSVLAQAEDDQLVVFELDAVEYAVEIDSVQEIIRLPEVITRVPNANTALAGVVNVRGEVLPIIDFRRRFELEAAARDDRKRVIVLTVGGTRTGFIVDSVTQVLKVPGESLEDLPALAGERGRIVRKVANIETSKRMILVLQAERLLDGVDLSAATNRGEFAPEAMAA